MMPASWATTAACTWLSQPSKSLPLDRYPDDLDVCTPAVTKRLVEIDDADLEAARTALATSTIRETITLALREATAAAARRREIERVVDGSSALMTDDGERARAWR